MKAKKYDGEHYLYEVMDRAYCMCNSFEDLILTHPSVKEDKELRKAANKVMDRLFELYQLAGSKNYDAYEKENGK